MRTCWRRKLAPLSSLRPFAEPWAGATLTQGLQSLTALATLNASHNKVRSVAGQGLA